LILAVNNGYLAAYAREVPTLLEKLTEPKAAFPNVAELAAFFMEPTTAEEVAVARGGSCAFAMELTAWALSADETSRQRVLDAVNDNTVLCGTQASGSMLNVSRRFMFVAKNEVAALTLAAALKRRAAEVSGIVSASLSKREEQVAFDEARRAAGVRAVRSAKLEIDGLRLSATVTVEPNETELRAMSKLLDERRETARRAATVVRNLAEGILPSGVELATYAATTPSMDANP
jgi:hypothetical protein